jgi:hypothetical protein
MKDNALCHKSIKMTAKLHELGYELLPHPPYSPDLAPSDLFLFADLKRMLAGKKFSTNEEVIVEAEAYFEAIQRRKHFCRHNGSTMTAQFYITLCYIYTKKLFSVDENHEFHLIFGKQL